MFNMASNGLWQGLTFIIFRVVNYCILSVWALQQGFPCCKLCYKRSRADSAFWVCLAAHNRHFVSQMGNKSSQIKSPMQLPRLVTFTHWSSCLWQRHLPNPGCCLDVSHWPIFFLPNIVSYVSIFALVRGLVQQCQPCRKGQSVYLK